MYSQLPPTKEKKVIILFREPNDTRVSHLSVAAGFHRRRIARTQKKKPNARACVHSASSPERVPTAGVRK